MGMTLKYINVPITKVDAANRLVYGIAALQEVDKTGETFHYETSVPYFKAWSDEMRTSTEHLGPEGISLGNVREMHGKSAAGKLTQLEFNDEQQQIEVCSKVVDDAAWDKVEQGVYTGFSIGGDYMKRWNEAGQKFYTAKPSEISLVDNPAMPGAHFSMIKMGGDAETRSFAKYLAPEEQTMIITNDMIVAQASELAKSHGTGTFVDYIEIARMSLEKALNPGGASMDAVPKVEGNQVVPSSKANIIPVPHTLKEPGSNAEGNKVGSDAGLEDVSVPKPDTPGNTGNDEQHGGSTDDAHPDIAKSHAEIAYDTARDAVQQGWKATDGSFHITKAAAIAHTVTLTSPTNKLSTALDALKSALSPDTTKAALDATEKDAEASKTTEAEPGGPDASASEGNKKKYAKKTQISLALQKDLCQVARLACLIDDLNWLHTSVRMEAEWEADASAVPAKLKADIASLVETLRTMVTEETAELFTDTDIVLLERSIQNVPQTYLIKYVAFLEGQSLAKSAKGELHPVLALLKSKCDTVAVEKSLAVAEDSRLAKGMEILAAENADLRDTLEKAVGAIDMMAKDVRALKEQPLITPPARLMVVEKSGAVSPTDGNAPGTDLSKFSPDILATAAIQLSQRTGGMQTFYKR
jgi:hypothetical protein